MGSTSTTGSRCRRRRARIRSLRHSTKRAARRYTWWRPRTRCLTASTRRRRRTHHRRWGRCRRRGAGSSPLARSRRCRMQSRCRIPGRRTRRHRPLIRYRAERRIAGLSARACAAARRRSRTAAGRAADGHAHALVAGVGRGAFFARRAPAMARRRRQPKCRHPKRETPASGRSRAGCGSRTEGRKFLTQLRSRWSIIPCR